MYIDVVPNRNSPPAVLLRESVRDGRRTLKRTLANLSALPEEAVAALRVVLRGGRLVEAGEHFAVTRSLPCGHVRAVKLAMQRLGMAELVGSKPSPERQAVLAMIAQRIVRPGSKLESAALFGETTLAEEFGVEGVDENALYAALDWLLERQPFIERKLAARHLREGAMVFYDVSSSSYHGSHCPLAKRGYNRDGLKLPGIVYGLLTDRDGRPVALRVYPGNTADPATVPDQIEAMRREFGVGRFVIVGDRGMLTGAQIDKLREIEGCGWISCLRSAEIRRLVEARDPSDAPLFTKGNLAEIEHPDFPGERLVVCHNELLAMDRERTRGELLDATEALLEKLRRRVARRTARPMGKGEIGVCVGRIINRHKMAKHFLVEIGEGSLAWSRKQEQIEREKALDGIYVVRTSEPAEFGSRRCAHLQEPGQRREGLPHLQGRGPSHPSDPPPPGGSRARAHAALHAGVLRRVAHAPGARSAALRRGGSGKGPRGARPRGQGRAHGTLQAQEGDAADGRGTGPAPLGRAAQRALHPGEEHLPGRRKQGKGVVHPRHAAQCLSVTRL